MSKTANCPTFTDEVDKATGITEVRRQEALLKTGALQNAIFNSANFSSIATDARGVIQIFNVGAERHAGLHGCRGDEQDHSSRHFRSSGSDRARQGVEQASSAHPSRRASRHWCSRPRAASRTSTS